MAFVIKVNYEGSLRRLTVPPSSSGAPAISFAGLLTKIQDSFGIPTSSKLVLTYLDNDGDMITMASDQELEDACVLQGINPLRLNARLEAASVPVPVPGTSSSSSGSSSGSEPSKFVDMKPLVEAALKAFDAETLKDALEPILKAGLSHKAVADFVQALGNPRAKSPAAPPAAATAASSAKSAAAPAAATTGAAAATADTAGEDAHVTPLPGWENVLHANVQCDVCNISPIVGPRFKSTTKHDYDLCVFCFNELPRAAQVDYVRYDAPIQRTECFIHPGLLGRVGRGRSARGGAWPNRCRSNSWGGGRGDFHHRPPQHESGDFTLRFPRPADVVGPQAKPDGRFVCDVTIPDGTEVCPQTRFVKIWRLRNSGKVAWAHDTKLMRVGGDEMGTVSAVSLQTEGGGVPPEGEIEVAVDLVAPNLPGRYVSYWRLVTPYGVKFGHRVWAMIQVTPSSTAPENAVVVKAEKPAEEETPLVVVDWDDETASVEIEVTKTDGLQGSVAPSESARGDDRSSSSSSDKKIVVEEDDEEEEVKHGDEDEVEEGFSLVNLPPTGKDVEEMTSPPPAPPAAKEKEAAAEMPPSPPPVATAGEAKEAAVSPAPGVSEMEKTATFIESMGFTNKRGLIMQLLEKNGNDFNRTLDDLVAASEWDPILEELQEMGFYDVEMNRKLMIKNNGSMKRVVKELVQMYKEPQVSKPAETR